MFTELLLRLDVVTCSHRWTLIETIVLHSLRLSEHACIAVYLQAIRIGVVELPCVVSLHFGDGSIAHARTPDIYNRLSVVGANSTNGSDNQQLLVHLGHELAFLFCQFG